MFLSSAVRRVSVDEAKGIDVDITKPNLRQTASNLLDRFTRSLLSEDSQVQVWMHIEQEHKTISFNSTAYVFCRTLDLLI